MLELYFSPFACSLAGRIALLEAGLEARYRRVDLGGSRLVDDDADFRAVSAKGQVPVLRLEDGSLLTEVAAVLQYIADRRPEAGLAPRPEDPQRYRLQEWLSFVGTELHKSYLYPTFNAAPEEACAYAKARVPRALAAAGAHLEDKAYLLGERFSVADAYLVWALVLVRYSGVDLATWPALESYRRRAQGRPSVREAIACEQPMLQAS